jgi:hypothetical protein
MDPDTICAPIEEITSYLSKSLIAIYNVETVFEPNFFGNESIRKEIAMF